MNGRKLMTCILQYTISFGRPHKAEVLGESGSQRAVDRTMQLVQCGRILPVRLLCPFPVIVRPFTAGSEDPGGIDVESDWFIVPIGPLRIRHPNLFVCEYVNCIDYKCTVLSRR